MHRFTGRLAAVTAGVLFVSVFQGTAGAVESAEEPRGLPQVFETALDEVDATPSAPNPAAELPVKGSDPAVLVSATHRLELGVPGEEAVEVDEASVLLDAEQSSFVLQSTQEGLRALVHIDSKEAPEAYPFELGGDAARLELSRDGSVGVFDELDAEIARVASPWAVDANGARVPTHFEVHGSTLVQVVEHRSAEFAYGIVADPSIFWWAKNIAVCAGQVALVLVPGKIAAIGTKIATMAKKNASVRKAKDAIDQLGGVGDTLRLMKAYVTSRGKKVSAEKKALLKRAFTYGGSMVAEAMGVGTCLTVAKEIW